MQIRDHIRNLRFNERDRWHALFGTTISNHWADELPVIVVPN
jgi:hypothetical protein